MGLTTPPQYFITIKRQHGDRRWVLASLRKRWFSVDERATEGRDVAEVWLDATGMNETETLAAALADLRRALLDELA